MAPALTQEVACQRLPVLKKGVPGCKGLPYQLVRVIHPSQHGMEQKRSEIQRESHGRQVLFAMAIVMFEMRAFRVEGVVVLVLDFPAGSSGLHDGLHAGAIHVVLRRKGIAIADGAVGGFGDGECTPIDPQRVFSLAQRDVVGIPIGVHLVKATIPAADAPVGEISRSCSRGNPFIQGFVRIRLTAQDEVASIV